MQDESRNRLVFRYYDPRVLRIYLPTCTPEELRGVFGPIERIWMEHELPSYLLEYAFDDLRLIESSSAL